MKTAALILTLALPAAAGAADFGLNLISARDLAPSSYAAVPAPQAELSVMDSEETSAYLADRETIMETEEKSSGSPQTRQLGGDGTVTLYHQWTRESLEIRYRDDRGRYLPEAMARIKRFMRCRLTGNETDIPPALIEIIDAIQERHGGRTVTVICGYRSPELNGALAANSDGVAKKSLHMKGWAADIKIDGVRTSALRDTARSLRAGGVGYYPSDGFVHVDIGAVRNW